MIQLKQHAQKGDLIKANMIAKQIALYRNVADDNFQKSVMIDLQAQLQCSNHVVQRAQMNSVKVFLKAFFHVQGLTSSTLFRQDEASLIKDNRLTEMACYQADIDSISKFNSNLTF